MKGNNMKKKIYQYGMLLLGLAAIAFSGGGCEDNFSGLRFDSNDKMQIYDYVKSREDLSIYKQLLDYTNFSSLLSTAGTYTAFVPTDDAFADLFKELNAKGENIGRIEDKPAEYWEDYLEYMTIESKIKSTSMDNGILGEPSMTGKKYYIVSDVRNSYKAIKLNSRATIMDYDIELANGYVDVIDKVLLPPTSNIYEMLKESGKFNTILGIFDKTGLSTYLQDSTVTVMVEPDNVLARDHFNADSMEADSLAKWAEYHIIFDQKLFDVNLDGKTIYSMFPDESLTFNVDKYGRMWLNQIYGFSTTLEDGINNVAENGIYHVLDTTSEIVKTLPGIRDYVLHGTTLVNDDGSVKNAQNIFCEPPAAMTRVDGFYNASMAVMDSYMIGDYCWIVIPDVVKGKWTVRVIYKVAQTVDFMVVYDNDIVNKEVQMNSSYYTWGENSQLQYKDVGEIDVKERGDVKLIFQVVKLARVPSACCDFQAYMIQLRPVAEK